MTAPPVATNVGLVRSFTPPVPQEGDYLAVGGFGGQGSMQGALYQDVAMPPGEPFLSLEWSERIQYEVFEENELNRVYAVLIVDSNTNAVRQVVRLLATGTAPGYQDTGWLSQSIDVAEFIGQTVRVMFYQDTPESVTAGQIEIDHIRLPSQ